MTDDLAQLEQLPTKELRERAVALARHRWDARFFWRLLRSLPAAEASVGHLEHSDATVAQASGLFQEAFAAESDPAVQEALRPIYIDYLTAHSAQDSGPEA
ncbi:hypothetical protein [Allosalinactinospora lopnorensis]|uniref:hypothetical protein n=1 Tax=Allosalinactinospora lopnorensis TaxID=1352348 RepID=UPI000623BF5E|nr:hypothetical protein [Allosalinactinospora lopnorensis]